MSAVLESVATPVDEARSVLEAVRQELAAIDQRIAGYEREREDIEEQRQRHRVATVTAVGANKKLPAPLKLKASEAETALPILRGKRGELAKRVGEAEGRLRSVCVQEVFRRQQDALDQFADVAQRLTEVWGELIGLNEVLQHAGVHSHQLPPSLLVDFSIPAVGKLRPICEHHAMHFVAEHSLAQGAGGRATRAARSRVEDEIGMTLPW